MKKRLRSWLVALIADGVAAANKRQHIDVRVTGHAIDLALAKERRRTGRSAS